MGAPQADDEKLEQLLQENPRQSTTELAQELSVAPSTVWNRLQALGKVQKVGRWVPHKLSYEHLRIPVF
jgi:predicted transcriptional regulator